MEKSAEYETKSAIDEDHPTAIIDKADHLGNYLDSDAKQTQMAKLGGPEEGKDDRAADAAEGEKDFVKLDSMVKFLAAELNMRRPSDEDRLGDLMDVILLRGQGATANRIGRN